MKMTIPRPYFNLTIHCRDNDDADSSVVSEMFYENVYRLEGYMLSDDAVVLDIGANIGAFTIQALKLAYDHDKVITVYAVEPEQHNLELLKKNLEANPRLFEKGSNVNIIEGAVSDFKGEANITNESGNSRLTNEKGELVDVTTYDDLLARFELERIDFVKIDIEGSEVPLINAANVDSLLKAHFYAIEWDESNKRDSFLATFKPFMNDFSFSTWGIPNNGCNIYLENHHWEK